jgi:hypothetical protein
MSQQLDAGKRIREDAFSWIEIVVVAEVPELANSSLNMPGADVLFS